MLIILPLNIEKYLVVISDFCMFHDNIVECIEGYVSFDLQTKIYFQTKKKTAKSTSCFQNKGM